METASAASREGAGHWFPAAPEGLNLRAVRWEMPLHSRGLVKWWLVGQVRRSEVLERGLMGTEIGDPSAHYCAILTFFHRVPQQLCEVLAVASLCWTFLELQRGHRTSSRPHWMDQARAGFKRSADNLLFTRLTERRPWGWVGLPRGKPGCSVRPS